MPLVHVLAHLFYRYGKVSENRLDEEDQRVTNMTYHPSDQLVLVYNEIKDLAKLGNAARSQCTDKQKVLISLKIIKRTQDFTDGLKEWYALVPAAQTWLNFKGHFQDVWEILHRLRGAHMQSETVQQANRIDALLCDNMCRTKESLNNVVQTELHTQREANLVPPPPENS